MPSAVNSFNRIYLLVSTGRSGLHTWNNQQKCTSAPYFRSKNSSLQSYVRANFAEQNEIARSEKARKDVAKFG
jgi:hypothetical protein